MRSVPDDGRRAAVPAGPEPQSAAGPPGGFDAFYVANFHRLILQLYAYTGDMAQAEDTVQEAFARAVQRWERLCGYDDPAAWVRRTAWNLATSHLRRLRRFRTYARGQRERHAAGPNPDRIAIDAALAKLPDRQRRAVAMYYLADMPVMDISILMGVSDGTVKSWLSRARTVLAAELSDGREGTRG